MAFITDTELGQLSAIPADILAEIDTTTKLQARDSATSKINGYLATRYGDSLPITTPPQELKQICADIAAYTLMSRHGYAPQGSDVEFRQRYDDAIEWLKDVARGVVTLDLGVATVPTPYRIARAMSRCPRGWDRVR